MEQEDFIHKWWSIHLAVLDQFWKKGCGELVKAEKMVRKKFVLLFVSAAANTYLSCCPSNRRRINGLRRTAITYPLVCTLSRKMMRNWKKTKTRIFAKLPSFHFTPSPGTRRPWQWGRLWLVRAWHDEIQWIIHSNQEWWKKIRPNIQPGTTENVSVATKEGVRPGDKETVWSEWLKTPMKLFDLNG